MGETDVLRYKPAEGNQAEDAGGGGGGLGQWGCTASTEVGAPGSTGGAPGQRESTPRKGTRRPGEGGRQQKVYRVVTCIHQERKKATHRKTQKRPENEKGKGNDQPGGTGRPKKEENVSLLGKPGPRQPFSFPPAQ